MSQPQGVIAQPRWFARKPTVVFGLVFAGAVLVATSFLLYRFYPSEENSFSKLVTPVGEDFFTAPFAASNEALGAYVVVVEVGTSPGTSLPTLLDTGSADTWFRASSDLVDDSVSLQLYRDKTYSTKYLGGDVRGVEASDLVSINGFSWTQRFGLVTGGSMLPSLSYIHGIMGLSRGGCGAGGSSLCSHANWKLQQSLMSFYYDPSTWQGVFTAGMVDEATYCADSMHYVQQNGVFFWSAPVKGLYLNDRLIGANLQGIFDTGTTYLHMKDRWYQKVVAELEDGGCDTPEFKLEISGRNFTIPTDVISKTKSSSTACALRIESLSQSSSLKTDLLIGAVFLVNFYTVFDFANDRLGFCLPKQGLSLAGSGRRLADTLYGEQKAARLSNLLDYQSAVISSSPVH